VKCALTAANGGSRPNVFLTPDGKKDCTQSISLYNTRGTGVFLSKGVPGQNAVSPAGTMMLQTIYVLERSYHLS